MSANAPPAPAKRNKEVIARYYEALAVGDLEALADLHHDDVVFNLVGRTPVSGRTEGKAACFGELIPTVVGALEPGGVEFARKWSVVCADRDRVVGLMQGGGPARNGEEYQQTYCQVFTLRDGRIAELHEFFDTALAQRALFSNPLERPEPEPDRPFTF